FLGSKNLGLRCAERLAATGSHGLGGIVTIDDRSDIRTEFDGFASVAEKYGIELFVAGSRKESEEIVRRLHPDLGVIVGWYWLLTPALLDSAPNGFIGLHNSLLPRYRGFSPLVWSL